MFNISIIKLSTSSRKWSNITFYILVLLKSCIELIRKMKIKECNVKVPLVCNGHFHIMGLVALITCNSRCSDQETHCVT